MPGIPSADACVRSHGAMADLAEEPAFDADYLHRWQTADGCPIRLDIVMLRDGGECLPEPEILLGAPPGSAMGKHNTAVYVRRPDPAVRSATVVSGYDSNASLPPHAEDSGFRRDGAELWTDPGDEDFVYLVEGDRVERLPRDLEAPGCA